MSVLHPDAAPGGKGRSTGALPLLADRMELFRTVFSGGSGSGSGDGTTVQAQMRRLWFDMAGTPFPHQVPALVDAFGSDRVLYGSDSCWTPAAGVTAQVASVDAASPGGPGDTSGGPDWRTLTSRNAARLRHRFPDAWHASVRHRPPVCPVTNSSAAVDQPRSDSAHTLCRSVHLRGRQ